MKRVEDVHKLREFGVPEAFWQIRVKGFPAVVTMDSHGQSIHARKYTFRTEGNRTGLNQ